MPEFILDHGSAEASALYASLDEFTQGFIEAMFFTDASDPDDGDLYNATLAELSPDALSIITRDCTCFQSDNTNALAEAIDNGRINGYDRKAAGRDFWYSRNGHGAGYFDRKLGDVGDRLQDTARRWGVLDLYRGDDRLIYFG